MGAQQSQSAGQGKDEQQPFHLSDDEKSVSHKRQQSAWLVCVACCGARSLTTDCCDPPLLSCFPQRLPAMSWSALSASRTSSRLLLSVYDVVYDVGELSLDHPGGREVLLQCAGGDATELFLEAMHPHDVWSDMKQMAVATINKDSNGATPAAAAHSEQQVDDNSAQPATLPQPASTASSTTRSSNSHAGSSSGSASLATSKGASSVRCLVVHGSQTGTASSQYVIGTH